jgi:hypothetical protein
MPASEVRNGGYLLSHIRYLSKSKACFSRSIGVISRPYSERHPGHAPDRNSTPRARGTFGSLLIATSLKSASGSFHDLSSASSRMSPDSTILYTHTRFLGRYMERLLQKKIMIGSQLRYLRIGSTFSFDKLRRDKQSEYQWDRTLQKLRLRSSCRLSIKAS